MLKIYYNSTDEIALKKESTTMFNEVSSGVYQVIKDRMDVYPNYVTSVEVVEALNSREKIAVTGKSGMHSNFVLTSMR